MEKFKELSAFIECSTGACPKVSSVKTFIDYLSKFGYNVLYLGLTDGYKMEKYPYFNYQRGGYNKSEIQELDIYAKEHDMELIPSIQTLANLHFLSRHDVFKEYLDTHNILLVDEPKVYELIEEMFKTMRESFSTKRIHIGMDEAFTIGTGRYQELHGPNDHKELIVRHLKRVQDIAKKYDFSCEIWSDMLIKEDHNSKVSVEMIKEAIDPKTKVFMWEYYQTEQDKLDDFIKTNKAIGYSLGYAGAIHKLYGLAPANSYSILTNFAEMEACYRNGIDTYMVTCWSDNGSWCNVIPNLPALFAISEFNHGLDDIKNINKQKFFDIVGQSYDDLMSLDYCNHPTKLDTARRGNMSYYMLFSDILICNYEVLISDASIEGFKDLVNDYQEKENTKYGYLFKQARLISKILYHKIKATKEIKKAYKENNKETLKNCVSDLEQILNIYDEFVLAHDECWNEENKAFGLEANQIFLGGIKVRINYTRDKIVEYLETGEKIEELEGEFLPPSIIPEVDEDGCCQTNYRFLLTNEYF